MCSFLGGKNDVVSTESQTSRIIRTHWKCIVDNARENVTLLTGYLYSQSAITKEEEDMILENDKSRDKISSLLTCVERKGWLCLKELVNALNMDGMKPLHRLAKNIEQDMVQCGTFPLPFKPSRCIKASFYIPKNTFKPSRCIKASFYIPKNRLNYPTGLPIHGNFLNFLNHIQSS